MSMRPSSEHGIALITTLLVLMLISSVLVGFTALIVSDQRYRFIDRDRGQAFYAASGALEKLTVDLGNLFYKEVAPDLGQITALTLPANRAVIAGATFTTTATPTPLAASELSTLYCRNTTAPVVNRSPSSVGSNGYTITFCADTSTSNPTTVAEPLQITAGPYADLVALKTPYQLDVTARTGTGGEVHLVRMIEAVAIPVFQFGIFSEVDLGFNAGDDFAFGGRVHTNGNLYLASADNSTLMLNSRITAVGDIVRQVLSNGESIDDSGHAGTVSIAKDTGAYVNMLRTWGSVIGGPKSTPNPLWQGVSLTTYKGYIRNKGTGAKRLDLPLITVGGTTADLTRRPVAGEDSTGTLFNQRLFSKASLRIMLSDTAADITSLPTVTSTAPILLDGNWNTAPPAGYAAVGVLNPPIALSPGLITAVPNNGGGQGGTITFGDATVAAAFKPTFRFNGSSNVVTCTGKTTSAPWQLNGCTGVPLSILGAVVTALSPAGGAFGASGATGLLTLPGASTISFSQTTLAGFKPMPFWDPNSRTLITCQGYTTTTYTGCSSNPGNNLTLTNFAASNAGVGLIGGYLKIERQGTNGAWTDVTLEILNYGIGADNLEGGDCGDPTPKAILRLQRLRDNGVGGVCDYDTDATGAKDPANWWPNVLYDTREGVLRDDDYPGQNVLTFNGVMHYITLDVANLSKWFRGTAPFNTGTGTNSMLDTGGYTVYFSDRRNNRNESNQETGEYGWENHVNPGANNGAPNGTFDAGENVNGSVAADGVTPTQQLYGGHPSYNGTLNAVPPGPSGTPFTAAATPITTLIDPQARVNRAVFFRHALKLVNGRDIRATGVVGLTIVAENPVYVQGDWNVDATGSSRFTGAHAATAIIADAVTVLTGNWNDLRAMKLPYSAASRPRSSDPWYRMAVLAGKSMIFPHINGTGETFGTDGGAHAFLRYLEGDPTSGTDKIHYRGSMATFYYSRQATGVFKGGGQVVYEIPADRDFAFDQEFLTPALLPPNTPVFRDINAVGFSQELRPGR